MNPITGKELGMNKESTKEKIEIMQAWLDGKPIEFASFNGEVWYDLTTKNPQWDFDECQYRIKPKEKVKKTTKYLCFEDSNGNLFHYREGSNNCNYYLENNKCTRIPEFDKTRKIEVEE